MISTRHWLTDQLHQWQSFLKAPALPLVGQSWDRWVNGVLDNSHCWYFLNEPALELHFLPSNLLCPREGKTLTVSLNQRDMCHLLRYYSPPLDCDLRHSQIMMFFSMTGVTKNEIYNLCFPPSQPALAMRWPLLWRRPQWVDHLVARRKARGERLSSLEALLGQCFECIANTVTWVWKWPKIRFELDAPEKAWLWL